MLKYVVHRTTILALGFLLCAAEAALADMPNCGIELQAGWRAQGKKASIFQILQNRNLSRDTDGTVATLQLDKPRAAEELFLYVRSDADVAASLNGTPLQATPLGGDAYRYDFPAGIWTQQNEIRLTASARERNEQDGCEPAVYLTCPADLERLQEGVIRISASSLEAGSVSLGGPVRIRNLEGEEYAALAKDPAGYAIDPRTCMTVTIPSPQDHVLKEAPFRIILTEFSWELDGKPAKPQSLVIDTITGPDQVWIDGILVGATGTPGNKHRLYYDRLRIYPVPDTCMEPGTRHLVRIVSHRSTEYLRGNIEGPAFRIGPTDGEYRAFSLRETIAVAIIAIYLISGLYYALLFLQRRENREYLFYFLSTVSLASYFFLRTQTKYLLFDDFFAMKRVEYVCLFLMNPFMSLFVHHLFARRSTVTEKCFRGLLYCYLPVAAVFVVIPLASGEINFWNAMLPYGQMTWIVPILYIIYMISRETFYYTLKVALRPAVSGPSPFGGLPARGARRFWNAMAAGLPARFAALVRAEPDPFRERVRATGPDGALMILAVFIMLASAVHDVLLDRQIISGVRLTNYGTMFFILGIAGILSIRILKLYRQVGKLNRELHEAVAGSNRHADYLQGIITGVDGASKDLVSVSEELTEIERTFTSLSDEQAASSGGMKTTFSELTSSIAAISESAGEQAREGKKTTDMIEIFNRTQGSATGMINSVLKDISGITESKRDTERNLSEMIGKMRIINEGGAAIKNFVEIINDISDRINLLSLNASIEAARAGDHGRGFAVVADEIGKLATATADNSKEISTQISRIIGDINEGMKMVEVTKVSTESIFSVLDEINSRIDQVETLVVQQAEAFKDVIRQAEVINELSGGIAASTAVQMKSMAGSAQAVDRLSEIAGEVASLSRRILSFTETITGKSRELQELIGRKDGGS